MITPNLAKDSRKPATCDEFVGSTNQPVPPVYPVAGTALAGQEGLNRIPPTCLTTSQPESVNGVVSASQGIYLALFTQISYTLPYWNNP